MMKNKTGPPVTGLDFFGREKERAYAWNRLLGGNNLNLPAPRRVGKTSFALKLFELAKQEGWHTVSINLEKLSTEYDFIDSFIGQLKALSWWEKMKDNGTNFLSTLSRFKPNFSYAGAKVELDWESNKEDIYKQLADLLNHEENTLIFFDELTILLTSIAKNGSDGKKNVTDFLHWLRDIRITAGSRIRWVYCSSVGIDNFTYRYHLSDTMNDIADYKLKSYTKEESIQMLKNLGESNALPSTAQILTAIVDKLDYCLPFFLQIMFEKIHYLAFVEGVPVEHSIVGMAYNALIEEKHFNTWIERIAEQYGDDEKYAFLLLKQICQAREGVTKGNLLNVLITPGVDANRADDVCSRLFYMLQNDGYLIEEKEFYRFRSPLLRDFWFNRFVK